MKIVKAGFEFPEPVNNGLEKLRLIEKAARTCYKSEDKITEDSCLKIVKLLIQHKHLAMLEHASVTVRVICDRGVSHELVRHRIASLAQESTRYCNYNTDKFDKQISVIQPLYWAEGTKEYETWKICCEEAEQIYLALLALGSTAQEARAVLPHSLKTEVVMTMNLREWRHFFELRACGITGKPHPQMLEIAVPMLRGFQGLIPVVFDDLVPMEVVN